MPAELVGISYAVWFGSSCCILRKGRNEAGAARMAERERVRARVVPLGNEQLGIGSLTNYPCRGVLLAIEKDSVSLNMQMTLSVQDGS